MKIVFIRVASGFSMIILAKDKGTVFEGPIRVKEISWNRLLEYALMAWLKPFSSQNSRFN